MEGMLPNWKLIDFVALCPKLEDGRKPNFQHVQSVREFLWRLGCFVSLEVGYQEGRHFLCSSWTSLWKSKRRPLRSMIDILNGKDLSAWLLQIAPWTHSNDSDHHFRSCIGIINWTTRSERVRYKNCHLCMYIVCVYIACKCWICMYSNYV